MPHVHVLNGLDAGKTLEVADGATFGRDPASTIVLRDASVSRRHARLALEDGAWHVHDTQSRNGLSVGGERVASAPIGDGAEFQLGDVRFRFELAPPRAFTSVAPGAGTFAPKPTPVEPVEEIVLEGEWSDAPPATNEQPARSTIPAARSAFSTELERTAERPLPRVEPRPSADEPVAPPRSSTPHTRTAPQAPSAAPTASSARGVQMRAAERGQGGAAAARPLLQFHKVEAQDGLARADLAQLPAWVKLALGVLALALFAGLFWLAFHAGNFVKEKAAGAPAVPETESDSAPAEAR